MAEVYYPNLNMTYIYDEYLEVFGDQKTFKQISDKLQKDIFEPIEKEVCKHKNISIFPNNIGGYCIDCAASFKDIKNIDNDVNCQHKNNYEDDNGLHVCRDCNSEIEILNFDPEWRYYGSSDNRSNRDPARCHRTRQSNKGLSKLFEESHITIPNAIKAQVELKYIKVVNGKTVRGGGRKARVAACLFHTYKEFGEYRTTDYIRNLFKLTKKKMSEGLTAYYIAYPKARVLITRPEHLLKWILTLTGINQIHYRKIVRIARYLEGSSKLLKRSSPQSVASAIIYFYLCLNPKYKVQLGLTKNKFAEKALLSDITVTKLVKEAAQISQCMIAL